jgi:hypothetical protein
MRYRGTTSDSIVTWVSCLKSYKKGETADSKRKESYKETHLVKEQRYSTRNSTNPR